MNSILLESTALRFLVIVLRGSERIHRTCDVFFCLCLLIRFTSSIPVHDTLILSSSLSLWPQHAHRHRIRESNRHRFLFIVKTLRRRVMLPRDAHQTLQILGRSLLVCVHHNVVLVLHSLSPS
ncbi:hypothetical protein BDN70DRAFT_615102 [Pholiota conissans]|uniref:Uncharacterized protein n=1 Tax=Pholiota conissans TaxID=109636 RepID=A0A9P5YJK6_9AGAR|nr:hypothetical protein BDN70DRAFT_615102 [Pholiota conissans]